MVEYDSFEDTLQGLAHFIKEAYNIKRFDSSMWHMSPEESEDNFNNKIRTC